MWNKNVSRETIAVDIEIEPIQKYKEMLGYIMIKKGE